MSYSLADAAILSVERAISDLKRGVPVLIMDNATSQHLLALATETLLTRELEWFQQLAVNPLRLIITKSRAQHVFPHHTVEDAMALPATACSIEQLHQWSCFVPVEEEKALDPRTLHDATPLEKSALALAKLAELLPSMLTVSLTPGAVPLQEWAASHHLLTVTKEAIDQYRHSIATTLEAVSSTALHLHEIDTSSIIAFRPSIGDKEHYAIMVGNPQPHTPPLVRIHSSCYTGDLLASLRCDCRDQLHLALLQMSQTAEGGIVIYLLQEGRGIGLVNKLRTYALQEVGVDTVDANEILGFEDDERLFLPAATILKSLGFTSIQLLTNNPRKIKDIEAYGITVTAAIPLITTPHAYNQEYLSTKAARLGHIFPDHMTKIVPRKS